MEYVNIMKKPDTDWHDIIDVHTLSHNNPNILLCPRVPSPLHGVNPRTIINQIDEGWWDRTRNRVYAAGDYTCMCCGVEKEKQKGYKKMLDAHELYKIDYSTGRVELAYIVALCRYCHNGIHFGRLEAEFKKGRIYERQYYAIIGHNNALRKQYGLPQKDWNTSKDDNVCNIPWKQWYLALNINGKEERFYSKWESQEEQDAEY